MSSDHKPESLNKKELAQFFKLGEKAKLLGVDTKIAVPEQAVEIGNKSFADLTKEVVEYKAYWGIQTDVIFQIEQYGERSYFSMTAYDTMIDITHFANKETFSTLQHIVKNAELEIENKKSQEDKEFESYLKLHEKFKDRLAS